MLQNRVDVFCLIWYAHGRVFLRNENDNPDHFYDVDDKIDDNCDYSENFDYGNRYETSNYNMIMKIYRFKTNKIMSDFIIY